MPNHRFEIAGETYGVAEKDVRPLEDDILNAMRAGGGWVTVRRARGVDVRVLISSATQARQLEITTAQQTAKRDS